MASGKKPRYFYGWNIVAAAFLAQIAYAEQHSSVLGLFFRPLQNELGWSRTALAAIQTIARVTEALAAPFVGPLADRFGPRVLMPVGALIVGLAMLGVTQIDFLWQFYLLRSVIGAIGFTLMGSLVTNVAINNWFIRKRGRAVAFAHAGGQLSNIIMTPVTVFVIAASGWRTMFFVFAVVTWLVVLIPSIFLMRRRPEDMGLHPDGIEPSTTELESLQALESSAGKVPPAGEATWNRREVLRTRTFWLLAGAYAIDNMAFQAINISLAPYIQDLGHTDTMVAAVITFRAIIMTTAVFFMGFIAEHAHKRMVRIAPFLIQSIGAFLFLLAGEPIFLWIAVATYGLGIIGVSVTQEVVWANYYGRLNLGMVRSMGYLFAFGFAGSGPIIMNFAFDMLGSYRPAFTVIIGLFIAAAILMATTNPPKPGRYASAADITAR
ncbi:MAG: MFS transporter [Dehalococcoidales bacterium]|nr:MFS transporter [Dehalococcoidales bacterium]